MDQLCTEQLGPPRKPEKIQKISQKKNPEEKWRILVKVQVVVGYNPVDQDLLDQIQLEVDQNQVQIDLRVDETV